MRSFSNSTAYLRSCPDVPGLPSAYAKDLKELFAVWRAKMPRNLMRTRYYDGSEIVKNLGIAVPDDFNELDAVVRWPAKAVDTLADMCNFDAYIGSAEALAVLDEVVDKNDFYASYDMLLPAELTHSCAAVTVTASADGLAALNPHDAMTAAMTWSYAKRRIKAGLTIANVDDHNNPIAYNLYEDDAVVVIYQRADDKSLWDFEVFPHAMGRPLIEPLVYRRSLLRPFGTSRIDREVMSITDNAMRTVLRGELGSEFFTSPQKVLLGAPDGVFPNVADFETDALPDVWDIEPDEDEDEDGDGEEEPPADDFDHDFEPPVRRVKLDARTGWEYYIGRVMAIGRDADGNIPSFVQVNASSMEPHISYLRSLASRFSGATSVPLNELGIVQDNPSSAEAIDAQRSALVREASKLNRTNGRSLETIGRMAVAVALNKPYEALSDAERDVGTHFMDPDRPALVSRADAMTKLASTSPWLPQTRVYWEKVGLTDEQIDEVLAASRQSDAQSTLEAFLSRPREEVSDGAGE